VAFARVLLAKPDVLFLDECTSALDSQSESDLYSLLLSRLPATTILSVAHRKELAELHDMAIDFDDGSAPSRGEAEVNENMQNRPFKKSQGLARMPC